MVCATVVWASGWLCRRHLSYFLLLFLRLQLVSHSSDRISHKVPQSSENIIQSVSKAHQRHFSLLCSQLDAADGSCERSSGSFRVCRCCETTAAPVCVSQMAIEISRGLKTRPWLCCEPLKKAALVTHGVSVPFHPPLKTCLHFRGVFTVWSHSVFHRLLRKDYKSSDRPNSMSPSRPAQVYREVGDF